MLWSLHRNNGEGSDQELIPRHSLSPCYGFHIVPSHPCFLGGSQHLAGKHHGGWGVGICLCGHLHRASSVLLLSAIESLAHRDPWSQFH